MLRVGRPLLLRLQLGLLELVLLQELQLEQRGVWRLELRVRVVRLLVGLVDRWPLVLRQERLLGGGRGVGGRVSTLETAILMMGRVRLGRRLWREV